jgi:hypothetical protein
MTVASAVNRLTYTGNGVTTSFPVTFPFQLTSDLVVVEVVISTGVSTIKTITTHYAVTGTPDALGFYSSGGAVVAVTAPASTVRWIIYRDPSRLQGLNLQDADSFPAESIEANHDKLVMVAQRLYELATRSLRAPDGDVFASGILNYLPSQQERGGMFLSFDDDGHPIVAAGTSADLGPVSSYINTLLDDASASAARSTLQVPGRVTTITALKNIDSATLTTGDLVIVEGYYASGDGGGGVYWWDGASSTSDNGGTILQPTAGGTGRWKLLHTGTVTVLQFGAKGDGVTNDKTAIQAAITYATANNQHVHIPGFIASGTEAVYLCTSQVSIPANRTFKLTMNGGHWQFSSALGANAGLLIDSSMMSEFDLQGEIIYAGSGDAVSFKPTTNVPIDAIKAIIDSKFKINTIVNTATGAGSNANVAFDAAAGTITNCVFEFLELNGEGAGGGGGITDYGLYVMTPGVGFGVTDNMIRAAHIHHHDVAGVQIGPSSTRATQIARNRFDVTIDPNATKIGMDVYGVKNYGNVNVGTGVGTPGTAIRFQSSANLNVFTSTELAGTATITNSSTTKANRVEWMTTRARATIVPGASPYAYQNTSGRIEHVNVSSGTVSAIDYSIDGTNYHATGFTAGVIILMPGDYLKVTYSVAPTMNRFL